MGGKHEDRFETLCGDRLLTSDAEWP